MKIFVSQENSKIIRAYARSRSAAPRDIVEKIIETICADKMFDAVLEDVKLSAAREVKLTDRQMQVYRQLLHLDASKTTLLDIPKLAKEISMNDMQYRRVLRILREEGVIEYAYNYFSFIGNPDLTVCRRPPYRHRRPAKRG